MTRARSILLVSFCTAVALTAGRAALGQDRSAVRAAYLRATGLEERAGALEEWLLEEMAPAMAEWPEERLRSAATYFAFVLAVTGVTADLLSALEAEDVDVVHAVTAETRPFIEQVLFGDLVVVGTVTAVERSGDPADGFVSSALVDVHRVLKGLAPSDTIVIRQRDHVRPRDVLPEIGGTYLLLLSNGMYRFNAANARGDAAPQAGDDARFVIYRIYSIVDDRLEWGGLSASETKLVFQEIRRLDHFVNVHVPDSGESTP